MRFLLAFSISIFVTSSVLGLEKVNQRLLDYAKACPKISASNVPSLVAYLKKGAVSESQTVEVFCYWIAENIAYDTKAYSTGTKSGKTLVTRKGVCQDYAELLQQMCIAAGIECHLVSGYAKGYSYQKNTTFTETNHAWNVIKVNGKYILTDATWASGYAKKVNGVMTFYKKLDIAEIMANPDFFVTERLPGDPRWQLRNRPITISSFEQNDSIREMLKQTASYYNFNDSIASYVKADSMQRFVMSAESAYRFNPIPDNLSSLATAYYSHAWHLGNTYNDIKHYNQSIALYEKAIIHYTKLNNSYGTKWISNCQKGITYNKAKIEELTKKIPK